MHKAGLVGWAAAKLGCKPVIKGSVAPSGIALGVMVAYALRLLHSRDRVSYRFMQRYSLPSDPSVEVSGV